MTFMGTMSSSPPSTAGRFCLALASLRVIHGPPVLVESTDACPSKLPASLAVMSNSA